MSLKWVLGRVGSGKTTYCLQEMDSLVQKEPRGVPLLLLVPEQATLLMEKALVWDGARGGMMRIQVLSFQRLVKKLFSEVRGESRLGIGEVGRHVMLTKILLDHKKDLPSFAPMASSPGLVDHISHLITELRTYRIFPHDLAAALESLQLRDKALAAKLKDVSLIYRCYHEATLGVVHDWDYEMEEALTLLPEAGFLRGAHVWVDAFKGFTPQERAMLMGILGVCASMTVTLPLDAELVGKGSARQGALFSSNCRIFETVLSTYRDLRDLALEMGVSIEAPVYLSANLRKQHPMLAHLERNFGGYPVKPMDGVGAIEIHAQPDERHEAGAVACRIGELVRDRGYRWGDIAVMTRGMDEYRRVLEQELRRYGVPFFMDDKRKVQGHALLTFVQALLDLARRRWQREDVFEVLRTGFFPLSLDEVDRLENLCLAVGVRAEDWERGRLWSDEDTGDTQPDKCHMQVLEKTVNPVQTFRNVSSWLSPVVRALTQGARAGMSVKEMSGLLMGFLQEKDVPGCLQEWAVACEQEGDAVNAQIHRQIWHQMTVLVEQMDVLLGETCLSLLEYAHIVDAGLRGIQLGVVPPRVDEVIVGAINRTRLPEVKVVFLIGCVQGILPPEPGGSQGLLDAGERAALRRAGVDLDPKGQKVYNEELFYMYSLLAAPTDKLILSYPLSLGGGVSSRSFLVTHVRDMFPQVSVVKGLGLIGEGGLGRTGEGGLGLIGEGGLGRLEGAQRGAPYTENREERIPRVLTRELYGRPFVSSVSQMELHGRCPFAFFVRYGLRGRERKIYRLTAPEAGIFSHALLNEYARMLFRAGENWHDVSEEEAKVRLGRIAEELMGRPDFGPLVREARHRFMLERQRTVLEFSVQVLSEGAREGDFVTIGVEMSFGDRGRLPAMRVPLAGDEALVLRGQIDRIDAARLEDGYYVRVVDYKGRERKVDLAEMAAGLDLQLPLYLEAAMQSGRMLGQERVHGGGMSYFALTEPAVEVAPLTSQAEIEAKRRQAVSMEGVLRDDPHVAEAFGEGRLIGKDGSVQGKACLTDEEFAGLGRVLRSLLRRQGDEIMAGRVDVSPARSRKTHGCRFCPYHSVCGFDPTLPGYAYRYVTGDAADLRRWSERPERTEREREEESSQSSLANGSINRYN